jgi:NADH-quinone oxidoreductase subunit H
MQSWLYNVDRLVETFSNWLELRVGSSIAAEFVKAILAAGLIAVLVSVLGLVLVYLERKVAAHMQQRLGPMRVGPHGIFQTVADTIKLISKEDIIPAHADRVIHTVGPLICFVAAFMVIGFIPFAPGLQVVSLNVALLFILGISSAGVLGIISAGWASNNKWSMLGAMRAAAQIISYELSATLALLAIILFTGTLDLQGIVESQRTGWWIWRAPVVGIFAFLIYLIASTAECNRTPFDIAEGESELTGGFHTEFSAMKFAMFFLSEFINVFTVSAVSATVFLGGWMPFHVDGLDSLNKVFDLVPPWVWFSAKTGAIIFIIMWFRWTFPRLRVDQLMRFEWKFLMPLALANLAVASVLAVSGFYFFRS